MAERIGRKATFREHGLLGVLFGCYEQHYSENGRPKVLASYLTLKSAQNLPNWFFKALDQESKRRITPGPIVFRPGLLYRRTPQDIN